nr:MAG TPA: hypothetical protein [Caudoviricetes sp.]
MTCGELHSLPSPRSPVVVVEQVSGRSMKDRPETCFCCVLYFPAYRLMVNTQIFSYAFRRCNKRILPPSR